MKKSIYDDQQANRVKIDDINITTAIFTLQLEVQQEEEMVVAENLPISCDTQPSRKVKYQ